MKDYFTSLFPARVTQVTPGNIPLFPTQNSTTTTSIHPGNAGNTPLPVLPLKSKAEVTLNVRAENNVTPLPDYNAHQAYFDERAGIYEYEGGMERGEAEERAYGDWREDVLRETIEY